MTASEVLKNTFDSARDRLVVLAKGVQKLETRALSSFGDLQAQFDAAPKKIEGAFNGLVEKMKPALIFATREELRALARKVDALADRVEKIAPRAKKTNNAS